MSQKKPTHYNTLWRWHFYAGLLVSPVILILAVTGGIYLFQGEIEDALYGDLLYLQTPYEGRVDHDALIASAGQELQAAKLHSYQPPHSPTRNAQLLLTTDAGEKVTAFIHPQTHNVLGTVDESTRLSNIARNLHKNLMLGTLGRVITELSACWLIVMIGTGIYLWWPRGDKKRGRFLPKLENKARNFWRELHATSGAWMGVWILALLFSGLPWSLIWGGALSDLSTRAGEGFPKAVFAARPTSPSDQTLPEISMNQLMETIGQKDIRQGYKIDYPWGPNGTYVLMPLRLEAEPKNTAYLFFDKRTGDVLEEYRWDDLGAVGKATTVGVAFHEGRLFGPANKFLNLLAVLTVIGLIVSGFTMWWKRKPENALGAPRASQAKITRAMVVGMMALGIFLPLFGASVLLIWLFDTFLIRRRHAG